MLLEKLQEIGIRFPDQVRGLSNATGKPYWYFCTVRKGSIKQIVRYRRIWICFCPVGEQINPRTQGKLRIKVDDYLLPELPHILTRFLSLSEVEKAKVLDAVGASSIETRLGWEKLARLLTPWPWV